MRTDPILAGVLLSTLWLAAACDPSSGMRGVPGVHVQVVLQNDEDAEQEGFPGNTLAGAMERDVVSKLQQAGIRVLTEEESRETPGWPTLFVNVNVMAVRTLPPRPDTVGVLTGAYSYNMEVAFRQWIVPEETLDDHPVMIPTTTWSTRSAAPLWRRSEAVQNIRQALGMAVEQFVTAWNSANSN
jgi:hypothetical protein